MEVPKVTSPQEFRSPATMEKTIEKRVEEFLGTQGVTDNMFHELELVPRDFERASLLINGSMVRKPARKVISGLGAKARGPKYLRDQFPGITK